MMLKCSTLCAALCVVFALTATAQDMDADKQAMIDEALSAAIPSISSGATVMDWEDHVLRQGSNDWTCLPSPPAASGKMPMCLDKQWLNWAKAWSTKTKPNVSTVGFAYMLGGDAGGSNTDPFATEPTEDNEWIEKGGPHLMVLVPNPSTLDSITSDYDNGGPWVMWKGTPYAHVMVPTPGMSDSD